VASSDAPSLTWLADGVLSALADPLLSMELSSIDPFRRWNRQVMAPYFTGISQWFDYKRTEYGLQQVV
jgi:hypothetical protein